MLTVLFFATLKEKTGTSRISIEMEKAAPVRELKLRLGDQFPAIIPSLSSCVVSVNRQFAYDDDLVPTDAEVAFFPPVSGGSQPTIVKVGHDPVSQDELVQLVTMPSTGAVCVFTGVVRGQTSRGSPHETAHLEYEAYSAMAESKMFQVAEEIRQKWPLVEGIAIVQRLGRLEPGTPTVVIACSAGHRDSGVFEAARYGIDRLKEIVPVWKKEIGPHGEAWVEGEYHPHPGD